MIFCLLVVQGFFFFMSVSVIITLLVHLLSDLFSFPPNTSIVFVYNQLPLLIKEGFYTGCVICCSNITSFACSICCCCWFIWMLQAAVSLDLHVWLMDQMGIYMFLEARFQIFFEQIRLVHGLKMRVLQHCTW